MITKIDIKNLGVFNNFIWDSKLPGKEFKKINIIYGRNYSGKTTLSRIIRSLETGELSEKYSFPQFKLAFLGGKTTSESSLTNHGQVIRVFNTDFVRDNLRFIADDEKSINSFAILGKNNTKLEEEIKKYEAELGSEEGKAGLLGELLIAEEKFKDAEKSHGAKLSDLERKLSDKANNSVTGIKHNKLFGHATYIVPRLKTDISSVTQDTYSPLSDEQIGKFQNLLREEPKSEISISPIFNLQYAAIASKAKELIEKKIQASAPIQELLNDAALATWVREGRGYHEHKRDKCAFCGSDLPKDLWEKLGNHFNEESEQLHKELNALLGSIEHERVRVPNLLKIKNTDFYSNFAADLNSLTDQLSNLSASYTQTLDSIKEQTKKRRDDIFSPHNFKDPESVEGDLNAVRDSYEKLRIKSNKYTSLLSVEQTKARGALRLHEVYKFINDIGYKDECAAIDTLNEVMKNTNTHKNSAKEKVEVKREEVSGLKAQLNDESEGANQVNKYLNNFFGHQSIKLVPKEESTDDGSKKFKFEVVRNNKEEDHPRKAHHLSEGECSLIAFCYFMAKLDDINTHDKQPIIWIDDPICSLDSNHIFFVYSLINSQICEKSRFMQLFISTHNLDFLKYLKRLKGMDKDGTAPAEIKRRARFFIVNRDGAGSSIEEMPAYMKNFVSEFNFLFSQIYNISKIESLNDSNYHMAYNFGNNARKFIEIYLSYKYPDGDSREDERMRKLFDSDETTISLIDRVNNEQSHFQGVFERGAIPVEIPEITHVAKAIVKKVNDLDPEQYKALLKSIGVTGATAPCPTPSA